MPIIQIIFFFIFKSVEAKIVIVKTKNRSPAVTTEAYLGSQAFQGFLKCGLLHHSNNNKTTEVCVKNFLSSTLSSGLIRSYTEALTLASEYSEPFYCSDKTKKLIMYMETEKYDFFLCFKNNVTSENTESIVFFVNERNMPRIIKFKM